MNAKEWLIKEGYPTVMNMTRDNLENILNRYVVSSVKGEMIETKIESLQAERKEWLIKSLVKSCEILVKELQVCDEMFKNK